MWLARKATAGQSGFMATVRAGLVAGLAFASVGCHRAPEELVQPPATATGAGDRGTPSGTGMGDRGSGAGTFAGAGSGSGETRVPGCPDDPEPNLRPLATTFLTIAGFDTRPVTVEAEIAKGDHDTQRGLMYRTSMPELHGMLFELDRDVHNFWMHNTCMSLDLIFIDRGVIAGIVERAPILNDEPRGVGKLADQVLELNAGFCQRHGVAVGQHVTRVGQSG